MGWAALYIEKLRKGETVQFRPRGSSMAPRIKSGDLCTVEPSHDINVGDVVLCKVRGKEYLHMVVSKRAEQYCIANHSGLVNGWVTARSIYGRLVKVEK